MPITGTNEVIEDGRAVVRDSDFGLPRLLRLLHDVWSKLTEGRGTCGKVSCWRKHRFECCCQRIF